VCVFVLRVFFKQTGGCIFIDSLQTRVIFSKTSVALLLSLPTHALDLSLQSAFHNSFYFLFARFDIGGSGVFSPAAEAASSVEAAGAVGAGAEAVAVVTAAATTIACAIGG